MKQLTNEDEEKTSRLLLKIYREFFCLELEESIYIGNGTEFKKMDSEMHKQLRIELVDVLLPRDLSKYYDEGTANYITLSKIMNNSCRITEEQWQEIQRIIGYMIENNIPIIKKKPKSSPQEPTEEVEPPE